MADLQTESMGTDQVAAIDNMFGNATPVDVEGAETGGDGTDDYSDEPAIEARDSEGQEEEVSAEEAQTTKDATEVKPETAQDRQARIDQIAKEFGLDYTTDRDRKIIDRMLSNEKRREDGATEIQRLREQLSTSTYLTEWEKSLQVKPDGKTAPETASPARAEMSGAAPEFNDGFNWKEPSEAITQLNEAYTKGDLHTANNIEAAIFTRRFQAIALPQVQRLVYHAMKDLTGRDLAPILEQARSRQQDQDDLADRDFAIAQLSKDPTMKQTLEELQANGEGEVKYRGQTYPNKAIYRIFAENPHILEMHVRHSDPQTANRLTWVRRFEFAAGQFLKEKKAEPPVKQLKDGFQAGAKTAKEQGDRDKIRQTVNAGSSKGSGRPVSADNEFLAGLSRTSGTTGIPASSMFRNK